MSDRTAGAILLAAGLYAGVGLLVGLAFVLWGAQRVDRGAQGARWPFRAVILPGAAALWPLMLAKWAKARRGGRA